MIIGISGKKQHGKDLVASIIQYLVMTDMLRDGGMELFKGGPQSSTDPLFHFNIFQKWSEEQKYTNSGFLKKQFASKLKQIISILIGCTLEQLEDNTFKEKELGEEWRIYYYSHYRYPFNSDNRVSHLYTSKEEAEEDMIDGQTVISHFGTSTRLESKLLTPRLILQLVGTECMRNIIHPNVWLNALMDEYKIAGYIPKDTSNIVRYASGWVFRSNYSDKDPVIFSHIERPELFEPYYPNWIITDVRFSNEAQAIIDKDGLLIRVIRSTPFEGMSHKQDSHPSETSLDDFEGFHTKIHNDGDIPSLISLVKEVLQHYQIIN